MKIKQVIVTMPDGEIMVLGQNLVASVERLLNEELAQ